MTDELSVLAEQFRQWVVPQVVVSSPLYAQLALEVAERPELLALCLKRQEGQPAPNMLFGAVHYLLLSGVQHPLRDYYADLVDVPHIDNAINAFADFCTHYRDAILPLMRTRRVQTNEVGRCALLMPAFSWIAQHSAQPLAILEIGASAGLHLCWDSYAYEYSNGQASLPIDKALVTLQCEVRGAELPLTPHFPEVSWRVGLELFPMDVVNRLEDRAWLRALLWPEDSVRVAQYEAAVQTLITRRQRLVQGDAIASLAALIAEAPSDCALIIVHSFVLYQFTPTQREAFEQVLREASRHRNLYSLNLDFYTGSFDMRLTHYGQSVTETLLAHIQAHGKWIEWKL